MTGQRPRSNPAFRRATMTALAALLLAGVAGTVPRTLHAAGYGDIPVIRPAKDANGNGLNDADDLIRGAREEAGRRPLYRSAYYKGGYPPENEGVCTDVIWRAFKTAGYDLKALVDDDIRRNKSRYPRIGGKPDPNIDFRRVPNLTVFFRRHLQTLGTTIIPGDRNNLATWQGGDIVVFRNPDHIAVLSDKRNGEGIPLLLHNQGPWATEGDDFMVWYAQGKGIVAHFRLKSGLR